MLRYVLIATVIVFVVGAIMTAIQRRSAPLRIAPASSTGSPSPPRHQAASTFSPGAVTGDAPWAFDALIDCFRHERTYRSSLAAIHSHIPPTAQPLHSGWVLESGPCTARIGQDGVRLRRGPANNPSVDVLVPQPVDVLVEATLDRPQTYDRRSIYVLRWKTTGDARLDRLATVPGARIERISP